MPVGHIGAAVLGLAALIMAVVGIATNREGAVPLTVGLILCAYGAWVVGEAGV